MFFEPKDEDFLDEDQQIRKFVWKDYWKYRERDPITRREVRKEKASCRRRIHRKSRKYIREYLKNLLNEV